MICKLCPRNCAIDRSLTLGYCKSGNNMHISYYGKFMYEEPCISGTNGSGAIFFNGCNLKCIYCQNYEISRCECGKLISQNDFIEIIKNLQKQNVHNINLVTPTHYSHQIFESLKLYKPNIPVVYNTNSYEKPEIIEKMSKVVDIFLADLKYYNNEIAQKYSNASDYFNIATKAIDKMIALKENIFDGDIMKQGVIIRVLILPSHTNDTIKILEYIKQNYPDALVSIMAQYTPCGDLTLHPELNRKITKRELQKVLNAAFQLDINGYTQKLSSAKKDFIPKWQI